MEGTKIPYKMLSLDPFSQWLGIEILECEIWRCKLGMTIRKYMLNSMAKAHSAITYSLSNTAFHLSDRRVLRPCGWHFRRVAFAPGQLGESCELRVHLAAGRGAAATPAAASLF